MAYSVGTQISTHLLNNARIPNFDPSNDLHRTLTTLSLRCHDAAAKGNLDKVEVIEASLNKAAADLWGLTGHELEAIQEVLAETTKSKRAAKRSTDDTDA